MPRARPVTVSAAAALMVAGAVVAALNALITLALAGPIMRDFRVGAAFSGATQDQIEAVAGSIQMAMILGGVFALVVAVVVGLLAVGVSRASNAARVATVVLAATSLCCGIGGVSFSSTSRNLSLSADGSDPQVARVLGQALGDAIPSWFVDTTFGLSCLHILGYIAVIVLLLLPPANAYFRRQRPPSSTPPNRSSAPP